MENTAVNRKHMIDLSIIFIICVLTEVFVCNANSFRMGLNPSGTYEQKKYTLDQLEITNADVNTAEGTVTCRSDYGGSVFIHIKDIDTTIGSIYMDLTIPDSVLHYVVCYTDEANAKFYRSFDREYVTGVDRTKWFVCHLSGRSAEMIIRLDGLEDGYSFSLKEIQVNKPVPFRFLVTRFMALFLIASGIYLIGRSGFFLSTAKNWKHNIVLAAVCAVFLLISIIIYNNSYGDVRLNLMYNCDFTDVLIKRQLHLDIDVSDSLRALENPYDTSVRQTQGVEYSWDTAYYNGKYYCYFGVVPALLFFVPYKLITGTYLQCNIVVMVSYAIYMLFLDITLIRIMRRAAADVPFGMEMTALTILNAAVNIFHFAAEPSFYMVLYATGLMFVAAGFCCFAFWYTGRRTNRLLLFLGAVCLSLAVGCRPPLLMYTLLIIPFGIQVIREKRKAAIADMTVLLIPYLVIGSALAAYNYLRFDSIFEFGVKYQLTAQDQVHGTSSLYEVPTLLWLGLFQPLHFSAVFPYVFSPDSANNYAGHFFIGPGLTSLTGQTPLLWTLFMPFVWKKWRTDHDTFPCIALAFSAGTGIVMLVLMLLNSGVEWRYTSEVAPILCIAAILLTANIVSRADQEVTSFLLTLLFLTAVYSFAVSFFRAIAGPFGYTRTYHPDFYYALERAFSFWK